MLALLGAECKPGGTVDPPDLELRPVISDDRDELFRMARELRPEEGEGVVDEVANWLTARAEVVRTASQSR
jgi:hypothetical protein